MTDEYDDFGELPGEESIGADPYRRTRPLKRYDLLGARLPLIERRTTLCGLEWKEPYWVGEPARLFRPEGLLCPSSPPGARLLEWNVGNSIVMPVSRQPVFLSALTFIEQLDDQARDRCRARPHIPACEPGIVIRIRIIDAEGKPLGPPFEPTVWGLEPHYL